MYHTLFGDSQLAENKLKRAESQRVKSDQAGHSGIGQRFRRDYAKLSEKVHNSSFSNPFQLELSHQHTTTLVQHTTEHQLKCRWFDAEVTRF